MKLSTASAVLLSTAAPSLLLASSHYSHTPSPTPCDDQDHAAAAAASAVMEQGLPEDFLNIYSNGQDTTDGASSGDDAKSSTTAASGAPQDEGLPEPCDEDDDDFSINSQDTTNGASSGEDAKSTTTAAAGAPQDEGLPEPCDEDDDDFSINIQDTTNGASSGEDAKSTTTAAAGAPQDEGLPDDFLDMPSVIFDQEPQSQQQQQPSSFEQPLSSDYLQQPLASDYVHDETPLASDYAHGAAAAAAVDSSFPPSEEWGADDALSMMAPTMAVMDDAEEGMPLPSDYSSGLTSGVASTGVDAAAATATPCPELPTPVDPCLEDLLVMPTEEEPCPELPTENPCPEELLVMPAEDEEVLATTHDGSSSTTKMDTVEQETFVEELEQELRQSSASAIPSGLQLPLTLVSIAVMAYLW